MVQKRQIEVYSINELEPEVQKKVLENARRSEYEIGTMWDEIEDSLVEYGKELFEKKKIKWISENVDKKWKPFVAFSTDYSHYPYATPTGVFHTKNLSINVEETEGKPSFNVLDHNSYTLNDISDREAGTAEKTSNKSQRAEAEKFKMNYKDIQRILLKQAEDEEANWVSDERLKENAEINEYEFLKNGEFAPR